jgi:Protein of unknown function (DUF2971)
VPVAFTLGVIVLSCPTHPKDIVPKSVAEQYPELLHYTTERGLRGILESGSFWASHASHLNDAEELTHFFDARLYDIAYDAILKHALSLPKTKRKQRALQQGGGYEAIARGDAERITALLRKATIGFHNPYVLSLSAPSNERIARNGLLSQWRGYGGDGGYALVLDTTEFDALLKTEALTHHYQFAQWGDVYYYADDSPEQPSSEEVEQYESIVRRGVLALVTGSPPETVPELYDAITSLSCLYKHWGFAEEHEVRVIAIPASPDIEATAASLGIWKKSRPAKSFSRDEVSVPYIELFKDLDPDHTPTRLPIKRVLVGPHRAKQERAAAVKEVLNEHGYPAEVICSEIPYLGR